MISFEWLSVYPEILLPLVPLAHAEGTRASCGVDGLVSEQPMSPNFRIDC
jgi:hypothetical protein